MEYSSDELNRIFVREVTFSEETKAFDSVRQGKLKQKMDQMGYSQNIIHRVGKVNREFSSYHNSNVAGQKPVN